MLSMIAIANFDLLMKDAPAKAARGAFTGKD